MSDAKEREEMLKQVNKKLKEPITLFEILKNAEINLSRAQGIRQFQHMIGIGQLRNVIKQIERNNSYDVSEFFEREKEND